MITSKSNELVKYCQKLKDKKYSCEFGKALVQSVKVVSQLYKKGLIECILVREDKFDFVKDYKVKIEIISDNIDAFLSDAVTSDGVFAICKIPKKGMNEISFSKCLLLDGIQDPSNFGAIVRSAYAFGFTTLISINSVYPFNFKGIRSSMGYVFDVDILPMTYEEFKNLKEEKQISLFVADMDGEEIEKLKNFEGNKAVAIGNEGGGVSHKIVSLADKTLSIPMQNNVESLNASVSAGIFMYLLRK